MPDKDGFYTFSRCLDGARSYRRKQKLKADKEKKKNEKKVRVETQPDRGSSSASWKGLAIPEPLRQLVNTLSSPLENFAGHE